MASPRRAAGTSRRPPGRWPRWLVAAAHRPAPAPTASRTIEPESAASGAEHGGADQPDEQHQALAAAVGHDAPRHQRQHHPDRRGRGDEAGRGQAEALAVVQRRDEERRAVHHHRGRGLGQRARREHRPASARPDLRRPRAHGVSLAVLGSETQAVSEPWRGRCRAAFTEVMRTVTVGVGPLAPEDVVAVARDGAPSSSPRPRWSRSTAPARSSTSSPPPPTRRTASRPASARWPPATSRPRCAPSCSARWSARTPPAPGPRSSARSSGR